MALSNISSQLKGQEATRNVALKELNEKDTKIQWLKVASRDVTQVQMQLCEEILLKEDYACQLSEAEVSQSEVKMNFEAELKERETSLRQSCERISDLDTLL